MKTKEQLDKEVREYLQEREEDLKETRKYVEYLLKDGLPEELQTYLEEHMTSEQEKQQEDIFDEYQNHVRDALDHLKKADEIEW